MSRFLELYNNNCYVHICTYISDGFAQISDFIFDMRKSGDLQSRSRIVDLYSKLFENGEFASFFQFSVERVLNPHYINYRGPLTNGNSTHHILLKILDIDLIKLDRLYDQKLTGLLRIYKNIFSVIDAPEYQVSPESLLKKEQLIKNVRDQMKLFIDSLDQRQDIETRAKLDAEIIKNIPFNGFYHLTHISNLKSIIDNGILARNKLINEGKIINDISNSEIQDKRKRPETVFGKMLHDYVPLYINPKNPFLGSSRVRSSIDNLALIEVFPHILVQQEKTLFSDGNAAEKETNFFGNKDELEKVNWTLLQNGEWTEEESKRIMCSEILVPDKIDRTYIQRIYIKGENILEEAMKTNLNSCGIQLEIKNSFFQLHYGSN
jgi:hypothetical protein